MLTQVMKNLTTKEYSVFVTTDKTRLYMYNFINKEYAQKAALSILLEGLKNDVLVEIDDKKDFVEA
jgi:L-rhamnose mutarotase